jgi:hypothetical protein
MATSNGKTKTILRIKRRRTEEPLPYIRLEGLDGRKRSRGESNEYGDSSRHNHVSEALDAAKQASQIPVKSSVLWKRHVPKQEENHSYRIVDAMLEEDGRLSKRRKLTLLETSSQAEFPSMVSFVRRKAALKVLDPLTRLVDDSLQQVHVGIKQVSEHYHFVTMDRRLAYDTKRWLVWCHSSGGNILHACALWNDVEVASEVLQIPTMVSSMTEAIDGDGRTPYEVAQLSGHDSVCEVLEAFGGDTTNYVYDIFCLEEGESVKDCEDAPMTVELTSGVGYWTPEGELVLEASEKCAASLDHYDEDGEIDSNCEEYGGNDYPDDEDWGDDFLPEAHRNHYHLEQYPEEAAYDDLTNGIYGERAYATAKDM